MGPTGELAKRGTRTVAARIEAGSLPGTWKITFRSQAVPGTLAAFAGTLAVARLDIISAVVRLTDDAMVTDVFEIVPLDGGLFGPDECDRLAARATAVLQGRGDLEADLLALRRSYPAQVEVVPRVETNADSSLTTGVNVVCADRPGLLYDVTSVLAAHGLRTRSLAVVTFGARAHDTFRVVDSAGDAPRRPALLAAVRDDLLAVTA